MKQRLMFNILIAALLFSSLSSIAAAQTDFFDSFNSITGGKALGEFYSGNSTWVDLIIYIFLFVYVAQFAFRGQQGMGKALPTVVGIALAIAAVVAETEFNFNLGQLGPFALALAMIIVAFTVYKAIHGMGVGGASSWAFAYIVVYGFLTTAASEVFKKINEEVPFVGSLLAIVLVIAVVVSVMAIIRVAQQNVPGLGGVGTGAGAGAGDNKVGKDESDEKRAARKAEQDELAELKELEKIRGIESKEIIEAQEIIKDLDKVIGLLNSGKLTSAKYAEVKTIIGDAQPHWAALKDETKKVEGHIAYLEKLTIDEKSRVAKAIRAAVKAITDERESAARAAAATIPNIRLTRYKREPLEQLANRYVADAMKQIQAKINTEKGEFEKRLEVVNRLESTIGGYFQQAMDAITRGRLRVAADNLKRAQGELRELVKVVEATLRTDLEAIKNRIKREYADLENAKKIAERVKRDLPV